MNFIFRASLLVFILASFDAQAIEGLKNESEAGISITSGNSNVETNSLKHSSVYTWEVNLLKGAGRYLQSRTSGTETARNWEALLRYERSLTNYWSLFVQHGAESDIFSGYIQRDNTDFGAKYFLTKNDKTEWFLEAGYRYRYTMFVAPLPGVEATTHAARAYSEINHKFNSSVSSKLWAEYIPNFKDSENWYLNGEPSVSVMLNNLFSLKSSYLVRYSNPSKPTRSNRSNVDTTFLTSLVATF